MFDGLWYSFYYSGWMIRLGVDVLGCVSGFRVRLVFFVSDAEGYVEKICYCFVGVSG